MRRLRTAFCVLLAPIVTALGLASGPASAALRPSQAVANVTIGNNSSSIVNLPLWVGQSDGYFAAQGLNVKIVSLTTATVMAALATGSVNFSTTSPSTYLAARLAGTPVEAIDHDSTGSPLGFIVSSQFAAAHGITAKTPIAEVAKDMVGSVGGTSAAVSTGEANIFFKAFGVQPSQFSIASLPSIPTEETALEKNQINWFVTAEPTPFQIQALGYGIVVGTPFNVPTWNEHQEGISQVIVASTASVAADPGLLRKMVRGVNAAVAEIRKHEQKVVTIATENLPGVTRALIFNSLREISWPSTGKMNVNLWRTTVAFSEKEGVVPHGTRVVQNVDWTNKFQ